MKCQFSWWVTTPEDMLPLENAIFMNSLPPRGLMRTILLWAYPMLPAWPRSRISPPHASTRYACVDRASSTNVTLAPAWAISHSLSPTAAFENDRYARNTSSPAPRPSSQLCSWCWGLLGRSAEAARSSREHHTFFGLWVSIAEPSAVGTGAG